MALKLPRLQRTIAMVSPSTGTPSITFHIWFDAFGKAIEGAVDGLAAAVLDVETTQTELAATQAELAATQADLATTVSDLAATQAALVTVQDDVTGLQTTVLDAVLKDQTAAWATPTGTFSRTTFASYAGQTISAVPTQAEVQAIDDAVKGLSQRLAALISDLRGNDVLT
jgi:hypothetical protein